MNGMHTGIRGNVSLGVVVPFGSDASHCCQGASLSLARLHSLSLVLILSRTVASVPLCRFLSRLLALSLSFSLAFSLSRTRTHAYTYTRIHIHTHTHTHAYTYTLSSVARYCCHCISLSPTYTHIHTHKHIHMHTQTHLNLVQRTFVRVPHPRTCIAAKGLLPVFLTHAHTHT